MCEREREKESGRDGRTGRERMLALTRTVQEGGAQSKFRVCAKYHLLCAGREGRYVCECVCLCMCGYENMFKRVLFAYKPLQETLEHTRRYMYTKELLHTHKYAHASQTTDGGDWT